MVESKLWYHYDKPLMGSILKCFLREGCLDSSLQTSQSKIKIHQINQWLAGNAKDNFELIKISLVPMFNYGDKNIILKHAIPPVF